MGKLRCDLPFTVRLVRSAGALEQACALRAQAYAHHQSPFAAQLRWPDALDRRPSTLVFLARCKQTGQAMGTARLASSLHEALAIDQAITWPEALARSVRCEVTRLAVAKGADARVRLALFKACYEHALALGCEHLVLGACKAALVRIYQQLGCDDVGGQPQWVPLPYAGNLPHRILSVHLTSGARRCLVAGHPLARFVLHTEHPDIEAPQPPPLALPMAA